VADVIGLSDVSTPDTGKGSKLKTGGKRSYSMPKKCVEKMIAKGMSKKAAVNACYPTKKAKRKRMKKMIAGPTDWTNLDPKRPLKALKRKKKKPADYNKSFDPRKY